jgi:hypothetical protein
MVILRVVLIFTLILSFLPCELFANPHNPPENHYEHVGLTIGIIFGVVAGSILIYRLIDYLLHPSKIEFESEDISIKLSPGWANIDGSYIFINPEDKDRVINIFYPFYIDDGIEHPNKISVIFEGNIIDYEWEGMEGITFKIKISAYGRRELKVSFSQQCKENRFVYILTTTKKWGKPLISAKYSIHTDNDIGDITVPYEFSRSSETDGSNLYTMSVNNFMPEKDLIIKWH